MSGWKPLLWFLAGAASGVAGLAYLNRNKMDFSHMKPICENIIAKGLEITNKTTAKFSEMKEELEDMAMAARDRVDAERMARAGGSKTADGADKNAETC